MTDYLLLLLDCIHDSLSKIENVEDDSSQNLSIFDRSPVNREKLLGQIRTFLIIIDDRGLCNSNMSKMIKTFDGVYFNASVDISALRVIYALVNMFEELIYNSNNKIKSK